MEARDFDRWLQLAYSPLRAWRSTPCAALRSDRRLFLGGDFYTVDDEPHPNLAIAGRT